MVTAKKAGNTEVVAETYNGKKVICKICVIPKSYKITVVPLINQNNLPTGCETCSAVMLLNFYGCNISEAEFTDNYLIKKDLLYINNKLYVPDPNCAFIVSPYSSSPFEAYSPVMAKSMNNYLSGKLYKAVSIQGESLEALYGKYIVQGKPVMVWTTINMVQSYKTRSWTANYTDENAQYKKGDIYTWIVNEHCLVLTEYDSNNYYFNYPCTNSYAVYSKSLVNTRYAELGKQAVVMEKRHFFNNYNGVSINGKFTVFIGD